MGVQLKFRILSCLFMHATFTKSMVHVFILNCVTGTVPYNYIYTETAITSYYNVGSELPGELPNMLKRILFCIHV